MKKIISLIAFLTISINIYAQKPDSIIGNWVFAKALNKNIDEAGLETLNTQVIGKWKFEFNSDGKFSSYIMGEKTSGEWKLIMDSKTLVLTGIEGGPQELKILQSSENELSLKLGLGEFLLTRIKENN